MTIDERLERLTERHEALTQSVELMAIENRAMDKRLDRIMEALERVSGIIESHETRLDRLEDAGDEEDQP